MGGSQAKEVVYAEPVSQPGKGETAIYRHAQYKDALISATKAGEHTMKDVFLAKFKNNKNSQYLGQRNVLSATEVDPKTKRPVPVLDTKYSYKTFGEVEEIVRALGSAIKKLNLAPLKEQYRNYKLRFIGVHGKNTPEWVLTDICNMVFGYTTMPLYDTLGEEAIQFMLHETELTTLFLTADLLKSHVTRIRNPTANPTFKCHLKTLVILDEWALTADDRKLLEGIDHYTFGQLIAIGQKDLVAEYPPVTPDDIACFSYTSGTTGLPKGAMISHRNLVSTVGAAQIRLYMLDEKTVYLSYLPLAHIFEKIVMCTISSLGAKYSLFGGDVFKIKDDLAVLKPTIFVSVPRLYNKFHDTIKGKMGELTGCKASLAKKAVDSKLGSVASGKYTHSVWDPLVFNKMKDVLGGNVQFMLSGSAPLSLPVKQFLKVAFSCPFMEGYGQTEGTGAEFCTDFFEKRLDIVGGPLPMNEFKLVDVPDMKYFSTDVDEHGKPAPRGEVWVRGHNVIPGYYKNDEKNAESFTKDGWLMSGDVGTIIPGSGALKIIDRKKNIFKLSQGEYVAPDKLEQIFKTCRGIGDIFVYGDSLKSVLVAIANLDFVTASKVAAEKGIEAKDLAELCKNADFKKLMLEHLKKTAEVNHLKGFERITDIYFDPTPFGDSQLVTTTFKLKRAEAKEHYKQVIASLYQGKD
jgi:long-chain acyl-CoA synthetase